MSHRLFKSMQSFFCCRGRQEKKRREGKVGYKKSRQRYISFICGKVPRKQTFTKFCVSEDIPDLIIRANFGSEKLRSLAYTGGGQILIE